MYTTNRKFTTFCITWAKMYSMGNYLVHHLQHHQGFVFLAFCVTTTNFSHLEEDWLRTWKPVDLETIAGPRSPMTTTWATSVPSCRPIILQHVNQSVNLPWYSRGSMFLFIRKGARFNSKQCHNIYIVTKGIWGPWPKAPGSLTWFLPT